MIKHVRIAGYKSLGDVSVDLEPVTVLVGRSGTGKSNFVEAFRFLRDFLATQQPGTVVKASGGWPRTLCAVQPPPRRVTFEVRFSVPGIAGDYSYQCVFKEQHSDIGLLSESLQLSNQMLFAHDRRQWVQKPPLVTVPEVSGSMLGSITGVQEVTIAFLALTVGLGCYDFPGTVFQKADNPPPRGEGLMDRGENHLEVINALISNLSALGAWREMLAALRRLNSTIRSVDVRLPDRQAILVAHALEDRAFPLDIAQESEGFRRFLAHLLALYQVPPKQTLIFEEPEKGIHPGALATLAEQFQACAASGRGQVLVTTHSPLLLEQFAPEQIRVAELHDHLTRIGPLAEDQLQSLKEHLLSPGELLTVDPARLATPEVPVG